MPGLTVDGDLLVRGNISGNGYNFPNSIIGDPEFNSGKPLTNSKKYNQYLVSHAQDYGAAAVTQRKTIHVAFAPGTLQDLRCGVTLAAIGAATVTIDLKKNGVSVLGAPLVLSSASAAITLYPATIATGPYVVGDWFELYITAAAGGGTLPQGFYAQARFAENPS